jgi:hypothetical protein
MITGHINYLKKKIKTIILFFRFIKKLELFYEETLNNLIKFSYKNHYFWTNIKY